MMQLQQEFDQFHRELLVLDDPSELSQIGEGSHEFVPTHPGIWAAS